MTLLILYSNCNSGLEKDKFKPVYFLFENDLESKNLYDQVKRLTEYTVELKNNNLNDRGKSIIQFSEEFTTSGILSRKVVYDENGIEFERVENTFDKNGSVIKSISFLRMSPYILETFVKRDSIENTETITQPLNDSIINKTVLEFGEHKYLERKVEIVNNDTSITNFNYELDSLNRILMQEINLNTTKNVVRNIYDSRGDWIETKYELSNATRKAVRDFEDGRIVRIENYVILANQSEEIDNAIDYDYKFNPIIKEYYEENRLHREIKYEYDFDKNGNWLNKIGYLKQHFANSRKFIPVTMTIREIEYWN